MLIQPLLELNGQLFLSIVLVVGGYQALGGDVPLAALIQFLFLANGFFAAIPNLGNQYNQALTAMAGAERVFALLDTQPDWQDAADRSTRRRRSRGGSSSATCRSSTWRGRPVLTDVSVVVEPGQTVALVGPDGQRQEHARVSWSRSSTCPTAGRILVDGRDLREVTGRRFIGRSRA